MFSTNPASGAFASDGTVGLLVAFGITADLGSPSMRDERQIMMTAVFLA